MCDIRTQHDISEGNGVMHDSLAYGQVVLGPFGKMKGLVLLHYPRLIGPNLKDYGNISHAPHPRITEGYWTIKVPILFRSNTKGANPSTQNNS